MPTNNSSLVGYLTPAAFLPRADARLVGDLCGDNGVRVSPTALLTDPNLAAALLDASGDVEAACLRGNRYQPSHLAGLVGAAQARLYRLLTRLTLCYLWERRPSKEALPEAYKIAWDHLEALASGEQIFGIVEVQNAGQLQSEVEDASVVEARNLTSLIASRYYGRRMNRINPPN